jgi:hypothetical protein
VLLFLQIQNKKERAMKQLLWSILTLTVTLTGWASDLPEWSRRSTKNAAFDQLIEWMQEGPFYRITSAEVSEIKFESGQDGIRARIYFDDSSGCKARYVDSDCTPVGDALLCFHTLTDCMPNQVLKSSKTLMSK